MVPVTQAIAMTFSGEYPCDMCKMIAEKKQAEKAKVAQLFQHEKKQVSPGFEVTDRLMTISPQIFFSRESFLQTRSEAPPVPPPRIA